MTSREGSSIPQGGAAMTRSQLAVASFTAASSRGGLGIGGNPLVYASKLPGSASRKATDESGLMSSSTGSGEKTFLMSGSKAGPVLPDIPVTQLQTTSVRREPPAHRRINVKMPSVAISISHDRRFLAVGDRDVAILGVHGPINTGSICNPNEPQALLVLPVSSSKSSASYSSSSSSSSSYSSAPMPGASSSIFSQSPFGSPDSGKSPFSRNSSAMTPSSSSQSSSSAGDSASQQQQPLPSGVKPRLFELQSLRHSRKAVTTVTDVKWHPVCQHHTLFKLYLILVWYPSCL